MAAEVSECDIDLPSPPSVILDIGANIGAYSIRSSLRWPKATIFAYEPVGPNCRRLEANTRASCPSADIRLAEAAIRSFSGRSDIMLDGNFSKCSFHWLNRKEADVTIPVECMAAESLPDADLIKIDTEGCEVEILKGLRLGTTKAVVSEYHRKEDIAEICRILQAAGFRLHHHHPISEDNGILKHIKPTTPKRPMKLFLGLPIYNQVPTQFMQCMFALQAQKPFAIEVQTCQGDGIARSRNQLTAAFLKSDCDKLLFIDCDLIFSAAHVERIASHDVDVVGGFYPKKQQGPLEWVINTYPEPTMAREDGLHKVSYIGTGFICVKRSVFERMIEAHPEIAFNADYGARDIQHDLWPMGVYTYKASGHRRYLSEDWYFCQRWMDLGGEVFGDTKIILKHIGPVIFPLITQEPEIMNPRKPEALTPPVKCELPG